SAVDADGDNLVWSIVSGDGDVSQSGLLRFTVDTSGVYCFVVEVNDSCDFARDTICIPVILNLPPQILTYSDTLKLCGPDSICFEVIGFDPNPGDVIQITQISGTGNFEMVSDTSGITCFEAGDLRDTTTFIFEYEITDSCYRTRTDIPPPSGQIHITIIPNFDPVVILGPDTNIALCEPTEICLPISLSDPDGDDLGVSSTLGGYNSATGEICFTADTAGVYQLIVTATDSCGASSSDTALITVEIPEGFNYICRADTSIFICDTGNVCVPISSIPIGVETILLPPSAWIDTLTGDVCFYTNCSVRKHLTLILTNGCQVDTCQFTVDVTMNSAPLVVAMNVNAAKLCAPGDICFPVGISDIDENIVSITIDPPIGTFDPFRGQVCALIDTSGSYQIVITATDSCGAVGVDTAIINVSVNSTPIIVVADSQSVSLCSAVVACVPLEFSDPDGDSLLIGLNFGEYNPISGELCFSADTSGQYLIIVSATDICGAVASDTVIVNVIINEAPEISLVIPPDSTIILCGIQEVCLPVDISDIPGNINIIAIFTSFGIYDSIAQEVCFTPSGPGELTLVITAVDACGLEDVDTVRLTAVIGSPPILNCPDDTVDVSLCGGGVFDYVVNVTPADAIVSASFGEYLAGVLTLTFDTSGVYVSELVAETECGIDTCLYVFNVTVLDTLILTCPIDTLVFICLPGDAVVIPFNLVTDSANVTVTPVGFYSSGTITFAPDTAGHYVFAVIATTPCGIDSCSFAVDVAINTPPAVVLGDDKTFAFCDLDTVCVLLSVTDIDSNIRSVSSTLGTIANNQICYVVANSRVDTIIVTATDSCDASDVDTIIVSVDVNVAPVVNAGDDFSVALCEPDSVCFPIAIFDANGNIETIVVIGGDYIQGGSDQICFFAFQSGVRTVIITVTDSCGAADVDTVNIAVTINEAPIIIVDTLIDTAICQIQPVCVPYSVIDDNLDTIIINFADIRSGDSICIIPDTSGFYQVEIIALDSCGVADTTTVKFYIDINRPPIITSAPDTTVFWCGIEEICIDVDAFDPDGNLVGVSVLAPQGAVFANGQVCYLPVGTGIDTIIVRALDSCGLEAFDTTLVDVRANRPPLVEIGPDTLFLQCVVSEVCVPVEISDPDGNIVSIVVTGATFDSIGGQLCLIASVDSVIEVIVTVTDACGLVSSDTAQFVVNVGEAFALVCPPDTNIFICEPDTLCVALGGIPDGAELTITPQSVWYDTTTKSLCFYTNCSVVKNIRITVTNGCFVDSCEFTVNVVMNSNPLVIAPRDTVVKVCGPQDVCFPVGISDADENIVNVTVEPYGFYDARSGNVCATVDSTGDFIFVITAIDACGASASDSIRINAFFNRPPGVSSSDDFSVFQCEPVEICVPVDISDPDGNLLSVLPSVGVYDPILGQVCFVPADSSREYLIITTATDSCGNKSSDTTRVSVTINSAPIISTITDTSLALCQPETVCIDVDISDPDGNLKSIIVSPGAWYDTLTSQVCFIPTSSGTVNIIIVVVDSCLAITQRIISVYTLVNTPPYVVVGVDTTVGGCEIQEVCFPVGITDAEYNLLSVTVEPYGVYDPITGLVCLTPLDTGALAVIITAVDSCGQVGADTTWVIVNLENVVTIECPISPIPVSLCGPDTVCQMIDINEPNVTVVTSFGVYESGQLCFFADTSGTYTIQMIASNSCDTDTCEITFAIQVGEPPKFTCPVDTISFQCEPGGEICRPVGVISSEAIVTVSPIGFYEAGFCCFNTDTVGRYEITVTAETECGVDTCVFVVVVQFNEPPVITTPLARGAATDSTIFICDLGGETICQDWVVSDTNGNILSVDISSFAFVDSSGQVCFIPDTAGTYLLWIEVVDSCFEIAADTITFIIETEEPAGIQCSDTVELEFCASGEFCIAVDISPASAIVTVINGSFKSPDSICITLDTTGVYVATVIAESFCGVDTCDVVIFATRLPDPTLTIPGNQALFTCQPDTLCLPISFSPSFAFVSASAPAFIRGDSICLPITNDTTYTVTITVATSCADTQLSFTVTTDLNEKPLVILPADFDVIQCEIDSVCFPVSITDVEQNIESILINMGSYNSSKGELCFLPEGVGVYCIIVTATDSCGASGVDTVCVTVQSGDFVDIICPSGIQQASLCNPDTICLLIPINGVVDSIRTTCGVYNVNTSRLCFFADTSGLYFC
ncbi:MAG: hypothetical protein IIB00_04595, partial [candidate division Zixibacteria bacterium]|nr:hypothetical protein [candidate division Zixibacteria bacterium]